MGSFHTITSQTRSGTTTSSPAGRSTSTGAICAMAGAVTGALLLHGVTGCPDDQSPTGHPARQRTWLPRPRFVIGERPRAFCGWIRPSRSRKGEVMSEVDTVLVLAASYDSKEEAEADYDAIKALYKEVQTSHAFDAAVLERDADGKTHVVKK